MKTKPCHPHPFDKDNYLTKHHIIPRRNGGQSVPQNILRLWFKRHMAWHQIFGLFTINAIIQNWHLFRFYHQRPQWREVFGNKTPDECLALLKRVHKMKKMLKWRYW